MKNIMMRISYMLLLVGAIQFGGYAQVNLNKLKKTITGESLSAEEVASGLKEALTQGTSKGADLVSKPDGYFKNPSIKILFPPDVQQVESRLRAMGLGAEVDKFIVSLNRAAEDAAREAKPIFVAAIKQMTIDDAWKILKGNDDAATQYLTRTISSLLHEKFLPVVSASLEKVNATKYYADLINTYNKVPMVQKVNPDLNDYATGKAIEGLFFMIAIEEKNIRQNPGARTSALLKKVFGSQ
jgi:hypothetical protein